MDLETMNSQEKQIAVMKNRKKNERKNTEIYVVRYTGEIYIYVHGSQHESTMIINWGYTSLLCSRLEIQFSLASHFDLSIFFRNPNTVYSITYI